MSGSEVDSDDSQGIHLLVLIHGMWGNPSHLAEMRRIMEEKRGQPDSERGPQGERLQILLAETNRDDGTYDGIDWGGERVAEEIFEEVKKLEKDGKKVSRFSVTGYSLGGLIARYVVGILHQRGFFENVTPVNFNTLATPHIGLPRYRTFVSGVFAFLGPKLLSRTGEQFYVVDKWSKNGRPLLEVMADPNRIFYQALTRFEQVRFYANAVNDVTVPYVTAAIELEDPFLEHAFNGIKIEFDEKYSPILKSYTPSTVVEPRPKPRVFTPQWFKSLKPERPLLPPALQFAFPFNILLILSTPILIPLVLSLVITRFALASRASRARIKLLEKDSEQSNTERLVHVIGRLEREMEAVAVDMLDAPGSSYDVESSQPPLSTATPAALADAEADLDAAARTQAEQKQDLVLADVQKKIVGWLNTLPGLKKELAFIHPVRNSHAVIISRDVKRFPGHKQGEGVLRHWADHFII
ncbi:putative serine esterase-domain-containing protein [Dichomitus squalens]|uniref:Putative serine esterase-domain-containing protein n=1 Tax=Dichomitus squalens TaxID=114155 RepID=A0A4Q9NJ16_9APHY|nr:putative serine esterase-domain-containing protein [Dichomitus squalens]TBU60543.1 putative serine esterase-domain-containing protein [Dichomitus squalens]